jgi:cyclase
MLREVGARCQQRRPTRRYIVRLARLLILAAVACCVARGRVAPAADAQDFAQFLARSELHGQVLRGNLQVLLGEGSNVVVQTGGDGTLLVDDEYAVLTAKLRAALDALHAAPVKVVIDTHWHNDHTGGNEALGRDGALIIAQENTARRLHSEQTVSLYGRQPALQPAGWPKVLVQESLRLPWNGDEIDLLHVGPAHTDGDLVVFFRKQNVLATGDLFVGPRYHPPFFDDLNGGSAEGMIAAAERLLALADAHTIIVPGHGPPTDHMALQQYHDQFVAVRDRIRAAIARGLSEDEVVALHPTGEFAGPGRGTDRWVRILYREYHH